MISKTFKCTMCRKEVDNQLFDHELGMCDSCSDDAWKMIDGQDESKPFVQDFEESIGE